MTAIDLDYAEKRMRQKWHDLVMEEQRGASVPMLERMFNAYMLAVEEYNRCAELYSPQGGEYNNSTKKKAS
ncbi:MAG: hypothetical protein PVS3B3_30160 [Ktedonobacteraceae bacterium]